MSDLNEMNLSDLREAARERGLPVSGTKDELRERLADASSEPAPSVTEERTTTPEEEPRPDAEPSGHPDDVTGVEPPVTWEAGAGASDVPQAGSVFELVLPAVRPEYVDQRWLDKAARQVLRQALSAGKVPCGDVRHVDTVDGGKRFVFRVPVR